MIDILCMRRYEVHYSEHISFFVCSDRHGGYESLHDVGIQHVQIFCILLWTLIAGRTWCSWTEIGVWDVLKVTVTAVRSWLGRTLSIVGLVVRCFLKLSNVWVSGILLMPLDFCSFSVFVIIKSMDPNLKFSTAITLSYLNLNVRPFLPLQ